MLLNNKVWQAVSEIHTTLYTRQSIHLCKTCTILRARQDKYNTTSESGPPLSHTGGPGAQSGCPLDGVKLLLQTMHSVQQGYGAAAHMSAGSRSTTCKRWMVNTPCRRRSVLLPRQCLQMMRPLPRHVSHSLVKISFISLKNCPDTMAKDATCACGRSLFPASQQGAVCNQQQPLLAPILDCGQVICDRVALLYFIHYAFCIGVRHKCTSVQHRQRLNNVPTVLSPRTTSRMGSGLSIAPGRAAARAGWLRDCKQSAAKVPR